MTQSALTDRVRCDQPQPWLASAGWDFTFIIAPSLVTAAFVLLFQGWFAQFSEVPLWAWVTFVLLIDVAHVYATLFRTYLDRDAFARNQTLLTVIPVACWLIGAMLYSMDALLFWRVLAYLAVFHFIRQQYGFIALYSRKDPLQFHKFRVLDAVLLYTATIYPVLCWHTRLPRQFHWFIDGDFISGLPTVIADVGLLFYGVIACLYLGKEIIQWKVSGFFNVPRNLLMFGTALAWWTGIVAVNSDMAFTITNVVAHGIPYMALVWLYHHRKEAETAGSALSPRNFVSSVFLRYVFAFVGLLIVLAYLEEGLWAGLVWREHLSVFPWFDKLPEIADPMMLALLVPLLSLPQSTHYVLDGFIWRIKDKNSIWSTAKQEE